MQLTYIREWKFSVLRREIWQSKYLKMAVRCAEINPPFLSIDSIKSLFGDWLHWKPPSALDYSCTVPISFFTVQRYGHLFHYTVRCKASTSETTLSFFFFSPLIRKILCSDSRASVWVLGIAPLSPDKCYRACSLLKISFPPHQHQHSCFLKSENSSSE